MRLAVSVLIIFLFAGGCKRRQAESNCSSTSYFEQFILIDTYIESIKERFSESDQRELIEEVILINGEISSLEERFILLAGGIDGETGTVSDGCGSGSASVKAFSDSQIKPIISERLESILMKYGESRVTNIYKFYLDRYFLAEDAFLNDHYLSETGYIFIFQELIMCQIQLLAPLLGDDKPCPS